METSIEEFILSAEKNAHSKLEETQLKIIKLLYVGLNSIAARHKPECSKKEFWMNIPHGECAETLITDTSIAREILGEVDELAAKELKALDELYDL